MCAQDNTVKTVIKTDLIPEVERIPSGEGDVHHQSVYPYCTIPPYYFDRALAAKDTPRKEPLFAVETWDGRNVFSLKRNDTH